MDFPGALVLKIALLIILLTGIGLSQADSSKDERTNREKLLVLPFEIHGLSNEEAALVSKRFADGLKESNRFEVFLKDSIQVSDAGVDPRSLAKTGSGYGMDKVVHVKVVHREGLYVLESRLVNVSDAALLYAERFDYPGEFGSFLSDIIPEQARKLMQAHLDAKTPWAKAAFLFGACLGGILWILWHFSRGKIKQASH
jgi:TolB-like protein